MIERRFAAILAADAVGFSTRVAEDETVALRAIKGALETLEVVVGLHGGRIFKVMGDGLLAEFPTAVGAVSAAMAMQDRLLERERDLPSTACFAFRIRVHAGEVAIDGEDLMGEAVNLAVRLEAKAEPRGVLTSLRTWEEVAGKIDLEAVSLASLSLKGFAVPVETVAISVPNAAPAAQLPILPDKPSIAVLPFVNLSSDHEQEHFVDGLTEDIITCLASVPWLFVIARNSSFVYKGASVNVRTVGQALGVRYILEGSVRKASKRIRITGQLIDAETGANLWADRFDGALDDVFDLQDQVTQAVVGAISPQITVAEIARAVAKRPENLTAYDRLLRALAELNRVRPVEAASLLDEAIKADPGYARALAIRAWCDTLLTTWSGAGDPGQLREHCIATAEAALAAGQGDSEIDAYAGYSLAFFNCDVENSVALVRDATRQAPSFAWAWSSIGMLEAMHGDPLRTRDACECAMRLSPRDPMGFRTRSALVMANRLLGDDEATVDEARVVARMKPDLAWVHMALVSSLVELGRNEEASSAADVLRSRFPDFSLADIVKIHEGHRNQAPLTATLVRNLRQFGFTV